MKKFIIKTKLIAIKDIDFDRDAYQRNLISPRLVQRKSAFRPDFVRCPIVAPAKNRYDCIDGQQRICLLEAMGFTHVTCELRDCNDRRQKAVIFDGVNDAVNLSYRTRFKAQLYGGVESAKRIRAAVERYNFRLSLDGHKTEPNSIGAVKKLVDIFDLDGIGKILDDVLFIISEAFSYECGMVDDRALSSEFLAGLGQFLDDHGGNYSVDEIADMLYMRPIGKVASEIEANYSRRDWKKQWKQKFERWETYWRKKSA